MKRTVQRNFRVDIDGTSLQPFCAYLEEARREAKYHSMELQTTATVVQLMPEYAVLDIYKDGELVCE